MKVATLICFMLILAVAMPAFVQEKVSNEIVSQQQDTIITTYGSMMELFKTSQTPENLSCIQKSFNLLLEGFAIANLLIHGSDFTTISKKVITMIMNLHATLVECGVLLA